jgi:hypothetical protein
MTTGLYLMAVPVALTMGMMLAPAFWVFRARAKP